MTTLPTSSPSPDVAESEKRSRGWAAVATLAPGAFALAASEFIPLGLVQPVAQEFSISLGAAGWMVLVPGLVAAIAAPLAVIGAGRLPRKTYVLVLAAILLVSNVLAVLAPSFAILLIARGLTGLALGGFWAVVPILAAQLVPAEKRHRATSIVIAGISAGTVVGLPAGQFIGETLGWRAAFGSVAILATCGTTRPTNPIPPATDTTAPVRREAITSIRPRSRVALMPSDAADSSPVINAFSDRASSAAIVAAIASATAGPIRLDIVAAETLPSRKNSTLTTFCASVEIVK